jgi:hypothetical protein
MINELPIYFVALYHVSSTSIMKKEATNKSPKEYRMREEIG